MDIDYDSKFKDLIYDEAKERYGIFHQSQLRMFASTQNECSICHIHVKPMKACYIDNKPKAVCEKYRIKHQSKLIEECKSKNKKLIIVNTPMV